MNENRPRAGRTAASPLARARQSSRRFRDCGSGEGGARCARSRNRAFASFFEPRGKSRHHRAGFPTQAGARRFKAARRTVSQKTGSPSTRREATRPGRPPSNRPAAGRGRGVIVKRWGKSPPRRAATPVARETQPGARPNRGRGGPPDTSRVGRTRCARPAPCRRSQPRACSARGARKMNAPSPRGGGQNLAYRFRDHSFGGPGASFRGRGNRKPGGRVPPGFAIRSVGDGAVSCRSCAKCCGR